SRPLVHDASAFLHSVVLFALILPPPPRSTLFPYTTLFRSLLAAQPLRSESQLARERLVEPDDLGSRRRVGPPGGRQLRERIGIALVEHRDGRGEALHRSSLPSRPPDGTGNLTARARGSILAAPL